VFGHLAGEAEFGAHDIINRRQWLPSLGTGFILAAKAVGEEGFILRFLKSGVGREALDILYLRVRADHVRLPGKDEDTQCFMVIISLGNS